MWKGGRCHNTKPYCQPDYPRCSFKEDVWSICVLLLISFKTVIILPEPWSQIRSNIHVLVYTCSRQNFLPCVDRSKIHSPVFELNITHLAEALVWPTNLLRQPGYYHPLYRDTLNSTTIHLNLYKILHQSHKMYQGERESW